MVARALEKGIPVWTEVELAYLVSEAPIIGITGSNGKTTTTTMIADVLTRWQIGVSCLEILVSLRQKLHSQLLLKNTLVMELSSFQLWGLTASIHILL